MKPITCLIVDNDQFASERLENLLSKIEGVEILGNIEASVSAVSAIVEKNPDLVFIEVEMPVKNGFDVMSEVRNKYSDSEFILVTSFNHYAIKAINYSVYGYLLKPVDYDELKEVVHGYIRSNKNSETHTYEY
ncbi:MAG: response regulator [Bacteroidetes bacterium]|nr:response regulator [Bacteroidota bacterium]